MYVFSLVLQPEQRFTNEKTLCRHVHRSGSSKSPRLPYQIFYDERAVGKADGRFGDKFDVKVTQVN